MHWNGLLITLVGLVPAGFGLRLALSAERRASYRKTPLRGSLTGWVQIPAYLLSRVPGNYVLMLLLGAYMVIDGFYYFFDGHSLFFPQPTPVPR